MRGENEMRRWLLPVTLLLAACTATPPPDHPLAVQLADVRFAEPGLLEQVIALDLRFTNPNPEPIRAEGLRFAMDLAGAPFGTGVSDGAVVIPRLGEAVVPVTMRVQTGALIDRLLTLEAGTIDYRLTGDLFQSTGLASRALPFTGQSSITVPDLPALLRRQLPS
jgi:LEA14-like dessication related protein